MDDDTLSIILMAIQSIILLISIIITANIPKKQRLVDRQNKTLLLLMNNLENEVTIDGMALLLKAHLEADADVAIFANKAHKKAPAAIAIRNLLNYYENVVVGVQADIDDVEMIKKSQKTMIIAIYNQSEPFIKRLRKQNNNPNLYIEFEGFIAV